MLNLNEIKSIMKCSNADAERILKDMALQGFRWNSASSALIKRVVKASAESLGIKKGKNACDPRCVDGYCILTNSTACRMTDAALRVK
jgi:hypothetical protein